MITQTFRTTTGKLRVTIPTQLKELTLKQLIGLQQKANLTDLDAIHILSGVPLIDLKQITDVGEIQSLSNSIFSLSEEIKALYNSDTIPSDIQLKIKEKPVTVKVVNNLSIEPVGAFMVARDIIADEIKLHIERYGEPDWQKKFNPSLQACSQILAQYLYCPATKKSYDEYQASLFTDVINELPVVEALPIAKHFFLRYPNLSKPKTNFWHRLQRRWNNAPGFRNLRSLNSSTLLML
ncbi:hypothetical protein [Mucilaginibacter lacusdianchii]|uniref:hypothetical protein n=1 Tax=Mucilaginibacter lacusdianchii TaxID=2684211 RepID=UPI00131C2872|nr:hypothetical protein [Mucilaginibacter sp. JXJ CY 39]